jgi:hypothetical protein
MKTSHRLDIAADNGNEVLFVCSMESCGRRLVVKRTGGLVVLDHGDFTANHSGGSVALAVTVGG